MLVLKLWDIRVLIVISDVFSVVACESDWPVFSKHKNSDCRVMATWARAISIVIHAANVTLWVSCLMFDAWNEFY